jgi:hypothetical protein
MMEEEWKKMEENKRANPSHLSSRLFAQKPAVGFVLSLDSVDKESEKSRRTLEA